MFSPVVFIFTDPTKWDAIKTTIPVPSDWYTKEHCVEVWGDGRWMTTLTGTYTIIKADGNTYLCEKH